MSKSLTPEVVWAQRSSPSDPAKNVLYVTFVVPNVSSENLKLSLTPTSISYKATNDKGQVYGVDIDFFEEIDEKESRHLHNARATECIIRKKEAKEEFWPRLTKEKVKLHWLKTDFDKWVDEDEQEGPAAEPDFDPSMMSQFGGGDDLDFSKLGAMGGMPGMGGMGGMPGMPGMPGMGGADLSGLGGMEGMDESDDEEMPGLEGEGEEEEKEDKMAVDTGSESAGKGKSKIEELD